MTTVTCVKWTPHVYHICINRAAKRNAINRQVFAQLKESLATFESDNDARVAILSGAGGHFSAGYDLSEIVVPNTSRPTCENVKQMLLSTKTIPIARKPVIACLEGYAAGFGFELALRCHYRVADQTAMMGFLNRRFDIPIMNGGTIILPQMLGTSRALELISTGRAMSAREALDYGLIFQVSDTGSAMGKATSFAQCLLKFGQYSLLNDINSVISTNNSATQDALEEERKHALNMFTSIERLDIASGFLRGEVCRHGKFRLHDLLEPDPNCTV